MNAIWTGSISFGLVSIPVRLYPATQPKDVRFHLYDRQSGRRVHYERVTREYEPPVFVPEDQVVGQPVEEGPPNTPLSSREAPTPTSDRPMPVDTADVIRGFELPSGDVVPVDLDELRSLAPERSRTIDIEEFVELAAIDPVFFEKSYYAAPARDASADKSYLLLLRAMQASGMAGIGRFVLRTKPHLVAIRALDGILGLETLYFSDEVRKPEEVARVPAIAVSDRELKAAQQLVGALAVEWVPEKHGDEYREELLELIRSKPARPRGEDVEGGAPLSAIDDLMATLKASVEAAKRRGQDSGRPRRRIVGRRVG